MIPKMIPITAMTKTKAAADRTTIRIMRSTVANGPLCGPGKSLRSRGAAARRSMPFGHVFLP
jgi:hypothetical protein